MKPDAINCLICGYVSINDLNLSTYYIKYQHFLKFRNAFHSSPDINIMHIYLLETMHMLIITIINNQDIDILLYHPGTIILYKLINFHQTRKLTMKLTNLVLIYLISAVIGQKTGEFVALIF